MATTSTGLGKAAYTDAISKAQKAANISEYQETIAKYEAQRKEVVELMRLMRVIHVDHVGQRGVDHVQGAIQSLKYELESIDRNLSDYGKSLARIQGTVADDNDD